MIICQIVAMSENRVIGKDNKLPWNIPEDTKFFKEQTAGHIVIMGRKTFDSLHGKPLKNRLNIVVTSQPGALESSDENLVVTDSVEKAVEIAKSKASKWGDEIYLIGGSQIYKQTLKYADRLYLTVIHAEVEGHAFYPELPTSQFKEVSRKDFPGTPAFSFLVLDRVGK